MTVVLDALSFDARDPVSLAGFWSGVLGWQARAAGDDGSGEVVLLEPDRDPGIRLRFVRTTQARSGLNPIHFDLTSDSLADQQEKVDRALRLGATHLDVGQLPDEEHVVLADPEGNEFCVIEPDNAFLAGCGTLGALSGDGSEEVGRFWSAALGWPLVWDQDEETAIQSPRGGPKITWGGPPLLPPRGRCRLHLDLAARADVAGVDAVGAEVDRLVALGARLVDVEATDPVRVTMSDPDGREFCLLASG